MTAATPNLNEALAKAKKNFPTIYENKQVDFVAKTGTRVKFAYAELEEIVNLLNPILSDNGLAIAHQIKYYEISPNNIKYGVVTTLRHISGEVLEAFIPLPEGMGSDPKSFGSEVSYARRYNSMALLDIVTVSPSNKDEWEQTKRKLSTEVVKDARQQMQKDQQQKPSVNRLTNVRNFEQKDGTNNSSDIDILLHYLKIERSRFENWYNSKYQGIAVTNLGNEEMAYIVRTICKTFAEENRKDISCVDTVITKYKMKIPLNKILQEWVCEHFPALAV